MASVRDHVFIYGPPGVGKSTIGKLLAVQYNLPFIDLDDEITQLAEKSIARIFAEDGEETFRSLEQQRLSEIILDKPGIVSLGGGALLNDHNRKLVNENGPVVFLSASKQVLLHRLSLSEPVRPLIARGMAEKLTRLLSERAEHYASFELRCDTDDRTPEEIIWDIQKKLGTFYITGMGKGYWVKVKKGERSSLGQELAQLHAGRSAIIITDENVGPIYARQIETSLQAAGFEVHTHVISAGESHKNLQTISNIWEAFTKAKLDRESLVIALGGGVVGDLAGFSAATYMRGIDWVNIPTTLLAMVDSSVGGKTGFDLPQGKNLVGAFHPPKFVLIDPQMLSTLPEEELRGGMAEVVKHAIIGSKNLYLHCKGPWQKSIQENEGFIVEALSVKVKMIQKDPYEKGPRAMLNLGHTIGHAIELLSDFGIAHGYAVAIGMVAEAKLAEQIGITKPAFVEELTRTLNHIGLPTKIPQFMNRSEIIETMRLDKKNSKKNIRFSLPQSVGQVETGVVLEDLEKLLAQIK